MKKHQRAFLISTLMCFFILVFSMCMQEQKKIRDPRGGAYAGSLRCQNCHKSIYQSYAGTAHAVSTMPASGQTIKGSFVYDSSSYVYQDGIRVTMEHRKNGFYQVAYAHDTERKAERFDIVVGSGRKAQTYLYWMEDKIFQLPVSYFVPAKSWVNSPNYPPHQVRFDRNIPVGCFECHGSFIRKTSTEPEGDRLVDHFDKTQLVYGIDCERCHGPAAHHADFHAAHPDEKRPAFLQSIKVLSREKKISMCAVCHSGPANTLQSTFSFTPGSLLTNYFSPDTSALNTAAIDVHGKQYQLLRASKCFLGSDRMDCSSCHNTHVKERENLALFSQRCMSCHNTASHNFCPMADSIGTSITQNCIDCHMPAKPSRLITLLSQGQKAPMPNFVRIHLIGVYPEETKKIMLRKGIFNPYILGNKTSSH